MTFPLKRSSEVVLSSLLWLTSGPQKQFVLFHLLYLVNFLSQFCKFSICWVEVIQLHPPVTPSNARIDTHLTQHPTSQQKITKSSLFYQQKRIETRMSWRRWFSAVVRNWLLNKLRNVINIPITLGGSWEVNAHNPVATSWLVSQLSSWQFCDTWQGGLICPAHHFS